MSLPYVKTKRSLSAPNTLCAYCQTNVCSLLNVKTNSIWYCADCVFNTDNCCEEAFCRTDLNPATYCNRCVIPEQRPFYIPLSNIVDLVQKNELNINALINIKYWNVRLLHFAFFLGDRALIHELLSDKYQGLHQHLNGIDEESSPLQMLIHRAIPNGFSVEETKQFIDALIKHGANTIFEKPEHSPFYRSLSVKQFGFAKDITLHLLQKGYNWTLPQKLLFKKVNPVKHRDTLLWVARDLHCSFDNFQEILCFIYSRNGPFENVLDFVEVAPDCVVKTNPVNDLLLGVLKFAPLDTLHVCIDRLYALGAIDPQSDKSYHLLQYMTISEPELNSIEVTDHLYRIGFEFSFHIFYAPTMLSNDCCVNILERIAKHQPDFDWNGTEESAKAVYECKYPPLWKASPRVCLFLLEQGACPNYQLEQHFEHFFKPSPESLCNSAKAFIYLLVFGLHTKHFVNFPQKQNLIEHWQRWKKTQPVQSLFLLAFASAHQVLFNFSSFRALLGEELADHVIFKRNQELQRQALAVWQTE